MEAKTEIPGYTVYCNVDTDRETYTDDALVPSGEVFASEQEALDTGIKMGEKLVR